MVYCLNKKSGLFKRAIKDVILEDELIIGFFNVTDVSAESGAGSSTGLLGTTGADEGSLSISLAFEAEDAGIENPFVSQRLIYDVFPDFLTAYNAWTCDIDFAFTCAYISTSGLKIVDGQEDGNTIGLGVVHIIQYEASYDNYESMGDDQATFEDDACCVCLAGMYIGIATVGTGALMLIRRKKASK